MGWDITIAVGVVLGKEFVKEIWYWECERKEEESE